jgi:hypothetical protein
MTEQKMDETALQPFDPPRAKIAELREEFMAIVVTGPEDHENYGKAHRALQTMVKLRTGLDKNRLERTKSLRQYIESVNEEAKELLALMAPVEAHLRAQRAVRDDFIAKQEAEAAARKEAERKAKLDERTRLLQEIGAPALPSHVEALSDEDFEALLVLQRRIAAERREREEREAMERAEAEALAEQVRADEAKRLKAEREELDRKRAEQQELDRKLQAERQEYDRKRQAEREAEQAAMAEQRAKLEAERRELEARQEAARLAEAEAERQRLDARYAKRCAQLAALGEPVQYVHVKYLSDAEFEGFCGQVREAVRRREELRPHCDRLVNFAGRLDDWLTAERSAGVIPEPFLDRAVDLVERCADALRELAQ